jgi:type VI secretion system VasD/TssJ family lipoprotein
MRTTRKMALLAVLLVFCSSCSWFSKKPVKIYEGSDAPSQAVENSQNAQSARSAAEANRPEPPRAEVSRAEARKVAAEAFRKEALTIQIKADPQLNRFQKNAHTLFLCIYQLKDPNGFNQLAEEKEGLPKLLECSRFDASVANAKQFVLQPGQELNDVRDRAEGARYLGLATGYYGTGREKVTELCPLAPGRGSDPSGTSIRIELGPYEITSVKVK